VLRSGISGAQSPGRLPEWGPWTREAPDPCVLYAGGGILVLRSFAPVRGAGGTNDAGGIVAFGQFSGNGRRIEMQPYVRRRVYKGPVQAVVLDWAGTAVDYGCRGPAAVFVEVFARFEVAVTVAQARQFMGLEKKEHIRRMCALPEVAAKWAARHGALPGAAEVEALYAATEPLMVASVVRHATPVPGLLEAVAAWRAQGIRIGSTTGYTRPMVEALAPAAAAQGYAPEAVVCSSDVPAGRPYPWMCYRNALLLGVYPLEAMVKIGDTVSDIEEGLNAGMWTIGVTRTGNDLGLSEEEAADLPAAELAARLAAIESRFREAGAHYVAEDIGACRPLVDEIAARLARGEAPAA
jgi:phosphonoacetaldehyde hydrolase